VLDLAGSNASAYSLAASGADVHRGDLEARKHSHRASVDAVSHGAFRQDWAKLRSCEFDKQAGDCSGRANGEGRGPCLTVSLVRAMVALLNAPRHSDLNDVAVGIAFFKRHHSQLSDFPFEAKKSAAIRLLRGDRGFGERGTK